MSLAGLGRAAVAEVYLAGCGVKLGVLGVVGCEALLEAVIDGEAVFGEVYGGLHYFGETHGAPAGEGGRPCADNCGNAGGQVAVAGDEVYAVLTAPVDGERLCGPAHAGYRIGAALFGDVNQRGDFAADAAGLRLKQGLADAHCGCGVDGVAAASKHLEAD